MAGDSIRYRPRAQQIAGWGGGILQIVLYQPEIPPNTGNVIRLAANVGARLHLIQPLGFGLEDARLRRAGLDYRDLALVEEHADLASCLERIRGVPLWALSSRAVRSYTEARFGPDDALLFGPETRGLPAQVLERVRPERCLRIPMRPAIRSLNLSNAVAVVVYEAWRQQGFR